MCNGTLQATLLHGRRRPLDQVCTAYILSTMASLQSLLIHSFRFSGALSVGNLPCPPNRQFEFHGFMHPSRGIYSKLIEGGKKPPTHFHPYQWEFFRVIKGNLTIDLNGVPKHLTKESGEVAVRPYVHHVVYGTPGTEMNEVEFVVSATDAREEDGVILDQAFFENWYGYQEDVFQRGEKIDLIQVLAVRVPHLVE